MRYAVTLLTVATATIAVASAGAEKGVDKHEKGNFQTLAAASPLVITGHVDLERKKDGTEVKLDVHGLKPDTIYAAHLHALPCSNPNSPGGGHYMNDTMGAHEPPNELWISSVPGDPKAGIATNHGGHAHGKGEAPWDAPEGLSVVIHAIPPDGTTAGGTKIACADLD